MSSPTPPNITDGTPIGRDVDLEQDDVTLEDGTRLTNEVADGIVDRLRRSSGRPSLSGQATASPQIAFPRRASRPRPCRRGRHKRGQDDLGTGT